VAPEGPKTLWRDRSRLPFRLTRSPTPQEGRRGDAGQHTGDSARIVGIVQVARRRAHGASGRVGSADGRSIMRSGAMVRSSCAVTERYDAPFR
jgi:hypothetical protein